MTALASVIDWFTLGLILGVENHLLEKIKIQHRDHVGLCKSDMLRAWLRNFRGTRTKQQLLNALRYVTYSMNSCCNHEFSLYTV